MVNLLGKSREKWRKLGYYVEGTESITSVGGMTRRNDLFGFCDLVALDLERSARAYSTPMVFLQVTSWANVSARKKKILNELTGKGQYAVPIRDIAHALLCQGNRVIIEGWRKGKNGRWESKEVEIYYGDLENGKGD